MLDLERLFLLDGVIAALRFQDDGTLAEAAGHLDQLDPDLAAELCFANTRILHQNCDILMTISDKAGWPPHGWMMMGEELSVCAVAEVACFVRNSEVSFNEVFRTLSDVT